MQAKADRSDYPHFQRIPTRWKDNDIYGHVNNVEYYSYFDTVINTWLINEGELDIHNDPVIGVCVESGCQFLASISFPDPVDAGLRIAKVGNSSVHYEIGLFNGDTGEALAAGHFVHVFVDRSTRRPTPVPDRLRAQLEDLSRR